MCIRACMLVYVCVFALCMCVFYAVVKVDEPAHKKIVAAFGESILLPTGELNRAALGDIIFNDASKRRILNQCTHPYIHRRMLFTILSNFFQGTSFDYQYSI